MQQRLFPLGTQNLDQLQVDAAESVFWEMEPSIRERLDRTSSRFEKEAWLIARLTDYGRCGFLVRFPAGQRASIIYCAPADAPGTQVVPTAPVSLDAQLISSLFIDEALTGGGIESILLDAAVMDLSQREYPAVEAFGLRSDVEPAEASEAVLDIVARRREIGLIDAHQLEGAGFQVVRDHPVLPRMRLELPSITPVLTAQGRETRLREAEVLVRA